MTQCREDCLHCLVGRALIARDAIGIQQVAELVQAIGDVIASLPTPDDRLDYAVRVAELTGDMLGQAVSGAWTEGKEVVR